MPPCTDLRALLLMALDPGQSLDFLAATLLAQVTWFGMDTDRQTGRLQRGATPCAGMTRYIPRRGCTYLPRSLEGSGLHPTYLHIRVLVSPVSVGSVYALTSIQLAIKAPALAELQIGRGGTQKG